MTLSLPTFKSVRPRRALSSRSYQGANSRPPTADEDSPESPTALETKHDGNATLSKRRKYLIVLSLVLLVVSIIFSVLVLTGQTSIRPVVSSAWFIRINLANIFIAGGTPIADLPLLNSIARSIGLHDFYQVGLWNFCEGYIDEGITFCSKPKALYYFNPVDILLNELFAGATIVLPADIIKILDLIRFVSNVMFAFFLAGVCLTFLYALFLPLSLLRSPHLSPKSRSCWVGFGIGLIGFLAVLLTVVAAVVGTVMFSIMKNVLGSQPELNIGAELGTTMLAFMWIAAGAVLIAWVVQWRCGCCCRKRRNKKRAARASLTEEQSKVTRSPSAGSLRWRGNSE